ncbi:MAG: DUF1624 domain-containing protein [Gammaproteobacteria bacterium]|nr:DUF1624 domain-containing protein [Gammaproteobacteria bacterium]
MAVRLLYCVFEKTGGLDKLGDVKEQAKVRYFYIDVWRGIAIVMMIVFHFAYDLSFFKYIEIDFNSEPFWLNFRTLIVTVFLCLVGISLQLAAKRTLNFQRYFRRVGLLVGAAALVSVGSYFIFSDNLIYFGVLHFIAVASVLGLLFRKLFWINLVLGLVIIISGIQFYQGVFAPSFWYWTGLMSDRPYRVDYVPLFPWFGVVLIGMFLARVIENYELLSAASRGGHWIVDTLAWGGRHSLLIYLLHQPLLFGGFYSVIFFMSLNK